MKILSRFLFTLILWKRVSTGLMLTSKGTLTKSPNPGNLIKVPLETASPSPRHTLF